MIKIVLNRAIEEYLSNFKVMLSYGVLFVFVILFLFFEQFFLSAGTVFIIYNESILTIVGLLLGLVFLYFLSFFISLTVYSIQRDVQKISFDIYWNSLLKKASIKIFFLYFLISVFAYILSMIGLYFGISLITTFIVLVVCSLLMYAPQSIVLDEAEIKRAIVESISFFMKNFILSVLIILFISVVLFFIIVIEFLFELLFLPGVIVSFILTFLFLVPFSEQMKSYAFVLKFNLIKQSEVLSAQLKPKPRIKIDAVRLRQKSRKGKI